MWICLYLCTYVGTYRLNSGSRNEIVLVLKEQFIYKLAFGAKFEPRGRSWLTVDKIGP
jgi:hypothetical protein